MSAAALFLCEDEYFRAPLFHLGCCFFYLPGFAEFLLFFAMPSSLSEINAVHDDLADDRFDFLQLLRDGAAVLITVCALVEFQHDGNEVGFALAGQNGVRDIAARIGIVEVNGESGLIEVFSDCFYQFRGRVVIVCADAEIRGRKCSKSCYDIDLCDILR